MGENNKKLNLEDIMYHSDGSFMPFVGHHGNIGIEIENYRNTYMEAERDYFSYLLADKQLRDYLEDLLHDYRPGDIFEEAITLQEKIESGELESREEKEKMKLMSPEERDQFHLNRLMYAEGTLCLLYAAIRDKALVLDEIESWEERFSKMEEASRGV